MEGDRHTEAHRDAASVLWGVQAATGEVDTKADSKEWATRRDCGDDCGDSADIQAAAASERPCELLK